MMSVALGSRRGSVVRGSHRHLAAIVKRIGFASAAFALALAGGLATTPAWATPIAVGAIAGAPGVSASGAATYGIPITLPPGTQGMQPSLSLVYSSQSGNGLAGYGWSLTGFSVITRCTKNIDDDGSTSGIRFRGKPDEASGSDDFCLDGQKLKLVSGSPYSADGTT